MLVLYNNATKGPGGVWRGAVASHRDLRASRGVRVVFAGYGRCMGGECVVFAGWAAYTGDERSRRRPEGFAWYLWGAGGVWAENAWYLRGGRPTGEERERRLRAGFAWYLRGAADNERSRKVFRGVRVKFAGWQYNSNFGGTAAFQNKSTYHGDINVNNSGRIFQRADANSSLNVISTNDKNFSLQSNRADDPTTGSIALQLNNNPAAGITMNRAVVSNQTFNSIGNITAEASLNVWGKLLFQHSSGIKETLNGNDYDLDI